MSIDVSTIKELTHNENEKVPISKFNERLRELSTLSNINKFPMRKIRKLFLSMII
jgi:ABC-type transporter Mla MlaB component